MGSNKVKPSKTKTVVTRPISAGDTPAGYGKLLEDLKARIRTAQVKAALSVNRELTALYWHIGGSIVERQRAEGWGKAIVDRLAGDLQSKFPGMAVTDFKTTLPALQSDLADLVNLCEKRVAMTCDISGWQWREGVGYGA